MVVPRPGAVAGGLGDTFPHQFIEVLTSSTSISENLSLYEAVAKLYMKVDELRVSKY